MNNISIVKCQLFPIHFKLVKGLISKEERRSSQTWEWEKSPKYIYKKLVIKIYKNKSQGRLTEI